MAVCDNVLVVADERYRRVEGERGLLAQPVEGRDSKDGTTGREVRGGMEKMGERDADRERERERGREGDRAQRTSETEA